MIGNRRILAASAGALGVAGAATVAIVLGPGRWASEPAPRESASREICLKSDLPFFEGAAARCYQRAELTRLQSAQLVDQRGQALVLTMIHSSDPAAPPEDVFTCRQYDEALVEGRYAATTRDIRRAAYFVRACGALDLLLEARPVQTSYFVDGSPDATEIASLGGDSLLRLGADASLSPGPPAVERQNATNWRISFDDQQVILQEIANADFDGDGIEEILAFLAASPEFGTAVVYTVALLEKDSASGPVRLTPPPAYEEPAGPSDAP